WTTVQARLNPAHDASGRVDIWLNGAFCGAYQGPMADRDYGARRNGAPFINAQPRFGIYRDWRAETQTIYRQDHVLERGPSGTPGLEHESAARLTADAAPTSAGIDADR